MKFVPPVTEETTGLNILLGSKTADFESSMIGNLDDNRPGHTLIEGVFDTGAVHSCAPPNVFPGSVRPSAMSRAGKMYRGPDSSAIPNLGQQDVSFVTDEGVKAGLTFQIANIERPLIAGTHITAAGNVVTLRSDGGEITNIKSGIKIALQRRGGGDSGGVYTFRMWVPTSSEKKVSFQRSEKA